MNATVKRIWNAVTWVLVAAVVVLAILLAGVRIVGVTPYAVLSGSMEPTFPVGSMIYVKAVDPADVEVGDAITFRLTDDLVATHRVIEITEEGFRTQGDANDTPDGAAVTPTNLVGKALFCVPQLGFLSSWMSQPPGTYIAGCAALALLVLMFLPEVLDAADAADKKAAEKKRQKEEGQ